MSIADHLHTNPDRACLRGRFNGRAFRERSIMLPPGFRTEPWLIRQLHNRGRRAGIDGPAGLNAFRRSRRDLEAVVAGEPVRW